LRLEVKTARTSLRPDFETQELLCGQIFKTQELLCGRIFKLQGLL